MKVSFTIIRDTATPALAAVADMVERQDDLLGNVGRALVDKTHKHVQAWGLGHPNKLGGRRTNYWSFIAAKINPADCLTVTPPKATVTLGGPSMPGLMRAFGPITIVPGTKTAGVKFLALPAGSESYGMRPGEFPAPLVLFWAGRDHPAGLATAKQVTRTRDGKKGKKGSTYLKPDVAMYWFVKEVTQPQDRSLLPTEQEWGQAVNEAADAWVTRELKKI